MNPDPFTVEQHLGPFDNYHSLRVADYAGVYFLIRRRSIVYVGKTKSVAARIAQHSGSKDFDAVMVMRVPEELLGTIEMSWIQRLRPKLNKQGSGKVTFAIRLRPETKEILDRAVGAARTTSSDYAEAILTKARKDGIT